MGTLNSSHKAGLVAWWDLDETSGNRLDATCSAPVAWNKASRTLFIQQNYTGITTLFVDGVIPPPQPIAASGFRTLYTTGHATADTLKVTNSAHWDGGFPLYLRHNRPGIMNLFLETARVPTKSLSLSVPYGIATGTSGVFAATPLSLSGRTLSSPEWVSGVLPDNIPNSSGFLNLFLFSGRQTPGTSTVDNDPLIGDDGVINPNYVNDGSLPLLYKSLYVGGHAGFKENKHLQLFLHAEWPTASIPLYVKMQTITTSNVANQFDYLSGRTDNYIPGTGSMYLTIQRPEGAERRMGLFLDCDEIALSGTVPMFLKNEQVSQSTTLMIQNTTSNKDLKLTLES